MQKGLKLAGIALVIIIGVFALLVIWQWDTVRFVLDNYDTLNEGSEWVAELEEPEDLLDYIEAHPDKVALHAIRMNETDTEISWRADEMQPVASVYKILILAEVARQIENDTLDPDQMVPVDDVRSFYLPRTDGEAHQTAFQRFDDDGLIYNEQVALREVIRAMIRWSDNAATDYLIHKVGRENLEELVERLDFEALEVPFPINGAYLLWENHEMEDSPEERFETYSGWERNQLIDEAYAASKRMRDDDDFRRAEQERLEGSRLGLGLIMQRNMAGITTPAGSAETYSRIMQSVFMNDFISAEVSSRMQEYLEWPMTRDVIHQDFARFGTKSGSLPAVFTSANYGRAHDEDPVMVSMLFQDLHFGVWFHLMQQHLQQDFEIMLMKDPEFWDEVDQRLEGLQTP